MSGLPEIFSEFHDSTISLLSEMFYELEADHIPDFVVLNLLYRDAANNKDAESYAFRNDGQLTMAQIARWLDEDMPTEEILASRYGLPNLAPLNNLADVGGVDDHCFMELTGLSVTNSTRDDYVYEDTPFSVIYQKTLDADSTEAITAEDTADQRILLSRLQKDTYSLQSKYATVNLAELHSTTQSIAAALAAISGMKLAPANAQIAAAGQVVLPAHLDIELVYTILHSALNHSKTRAELVQHFGEVRVATFHSDFITLTGRR